MAGPEKQVALERPSTVQFIKKKIIFQNEKALHWNSCNAP